MKPYFQLIATKRLKDSGFDAEPENTGYTRLLLSPGIEIGADAWRVFADVEIPVFHDVNGVQRVAPVLFKAAVTYSP